MEHTPALSIITPVWNGLPYLKECVESVLMQQFTDWEMIVSDDGSTDGSREYLATLNDPRIRVTFQEKNRGIFGNLNFLFEQATAPISQILCQDDYFVTDTALNTLMTYWAANPDVGFVRYNQDADVQCSLTAYSKSLEISRLTPDISDLYFFVFGNLPGNLSNVSLRTHIVAECGGFRQSLPYAGDFDFWSRAARRYVMGIENEVICHIRRHPGVASIHLNRKGELLGQNREIFTTLFQHIVQRHPELRSLLRLHGVLNFDALQRDAAVRILLKGQTSYLRELDRVSKGAEFMLKPMWLWPIFAASVGGRMGRVAVAKQLLRHA